MKENSKDLKKVAQQFFSAYDAHDVDGMNALFRTDARRWYVPYGKQSVAPVLGGIDAIWRAFPQAVKGFRVEVVDMLLAEGNTIVAGALVGGPLPRPDPLGISKDGQPVMIPHVFILPFATAAQISPVTPHWHNAFLH